MDSGDGVKKRKVIKKAKNQELDKAMESGLYKNEA